VTDLLNDMVRIGSISTERSFKSFGLISSGPAALDGFKLHISPTFFHSANLMLNSGKKNILTLVLSKKKFLNETKNHSALALLPKLRGS
jgi:hypothetical protein